MAAVETIELETPYQYEPLASNEIRVLVLSPGDRDDVLWGYFEAVSLEARPVYKALSYAWGKPVFPHTLHAVGGDVAISSTVQAALHRLRDPKVPVRLWIDAICIDQRDVAEKNVQVEMMARIYREAEQVLVWLAGEGKFDCHNHQLVQLLCFTNGTCGGSTGAETKGVR